MEKFIKTSIVILGLMPYFFIVSFAIFYFHAGNILGYYPIYGKPNHEDLSIFVFYNDLISLTFVFSLFGFTIWLSLVLPKLYKFIFKSENQSNLFAISIGLFGYFTNMLLILSDFFEWILD
jgi:hypothetical protein